jgi:hypothetical protein
MRQYVALGSLGELHVVVPDVSRKTDVRDETVFEMFAWYLRVAGCADACVGADST